MARTPAPLGLVALTLGFRFLMLRSDLAVHPLEATDRNWSAPDLLVPVYDTFNGNEKARDKTR